ncbi:MAG: phosphotransferase [Anaerolineales bacterium]|nr:phosphotransferase [Anaerolineales bacterium]
MEDRIKKRFNKSILEKALDCYLILPEQAQPLDGFESFIFEFERDEGPGILRISHSIRRSIELIRGELDWINYLFNGGASVACPIPSKSGEWVEIIEDGAGGSFLAAAFERAEGESHRGKGWSPELLFNYGRLIGQLHRMSRDYKPQQVSWKRPQWDDPVMLEIDQYLPEEDQQVMRIYVELRDYLRDLPRDIASYGLIHQDAHQGNFFVTESGKITLFDFDDCVYSWFVNDIALVLFYAAMGQEDQAAFVTEFLTGFLPGYFREHQLDPIWFKEIPNFLKLREIDLYAVIHRSFDVENLDDPWCIRYMDGRKKRIEGNIPYLDFDFDQFSV